jgi:membrane protein YqaA with SNARE-associated domain
MTYLVLFLIAAGFAMIPLPLFPSWVVVAFMVVEYDLRLLLAILVGALGTTLGRVILVLVSRVAGERMLGSWSRGNLEYLHAKLEGAAGDLGIGVLLASSPPPAGVLFILAGLMRVALWLVAVSVFVGRTIGYVISVGGTSLAAEPLADKLRGLIGPWSVIVAVAIISAVLVLALRVDYRALIEDRKFRIHRGRR